MSADYQLEVRLLSYSNPGGRTDLGSCCDVEEPAGICLMADTCDTQFTIQAQNFHLQLGLGSPIDLEEFNNTDSITFPNCGEIGGRRIPLVFTFSSTDYDITRVC